MYYIYILGHNYLIVTLTKSCFKRNTKVMKQICESLNLTSATSQSTILILREELHETMNYILNFHNIREEPRHT